MEHGSNPLLLVQPALLMSSAPGRDAPSAEVAEIASLVRRTIAGDSTAFEPVVLRYQRRVLTLAIRLLGSMEDAQDAAQEVFLRAFKYIHRLDPGRPVEPWLVRITVNVCRDIGRKRQLRRTTFPEMTTADEQEVQDAGGGVDPYAGFAGEQRKQMLWKALNDLPAKERLAVVLRDVEGLSTPEVAEILKSSESTVRSQVSRARLRMKETIGQMTRGGQQ